MASGRQPTAKSHAQVEDQIDQALAETFPASDPPFFMASQLGLGRPMPTGNGTPEQELGVSRDAGPARASRRKR